jgi:hypothetical protein
MKTMKLPAFIGMIALSIFPIKILAQDEASFALNPADRCENSALVLSESKLAVEQEDDGVRKKNYLEYIRAEVKLNQIDLRCISVAPHTVGYGTLTVARMLVTEAEGYELAASAAYCAHRKDLENLYLSKAALYLNRVEPEGLADEPLEAPGLEMEKYVNTKEALYNPDHSCIIFK